MNEEKTNTLTAQIEALLFAYGEALEIKRMAKILGQGEAETESALRELHSQLGGSGRGLTLIFTDGKVQLATKPEFQGLLQNIVKEELNEALTPAALETLSIIAYSGPLPRSIIDYVRGVNSSFILRALLLRGLVNRKPDPGRGNAYVYSASFDLLRHLGITKTEDLPEYQKFRGIVEKLTANP